MDFQSIVVEYKGRLVETFDENFGWWYIVEDGVTKFFVMLNQSMEYMAPGCNAGDYEGAIQEQFRRTLELSSDGKMTGKIFFNSPLATLEVPQATDHLLIIKQEDAIMGSTMRNLSTVKSKSIDDGLLLMDIGETAVHELLHTLRVDHPHEKTQTTDCKLIYVSGNDFKSTSSTDLNIHYNIMLYGNVVINNLKVGDLWNTKRPEYLTKGQLNFMIKEIDRQKNGEGCQKDDQYPYLQYWDDYPGEEITIQK